MVDDVDTVFGGSAAFWLGVKRPDPGVARVREFHRAFDCVVREEPGLFELSDADATWLRSFAARLLDMGRELKTHAAMANEVRRAALGLYLIRLQLSVEETGELAEALADQDLVKALDALTDMSYVTDGHYLTLGLGDVKAAAYDEVHRSNMSKLGADGRPVISPGGRVEKGPNYSPPDLGRVLREAKES